MTSLDLQMTLLLVQPSMVLPALPQDNTIGSYLVYGPLQSQVLFCITAT